MTTIVGIDAKNRKNGIILASDLNRTLEKWDAKGDVAYRKQSKKEAQKIHISDKQDLALCMTGVVDAPWVNFLTSVRKGKIDMEKALKEGFSEEFRNLNLSRWQGEYPNAEIMNAMVIATRYNGKPELYAFSPLGKIQRRAWVAAGSGSDYAVDFLTDKASEIPYYTTLKQGVDLAIESLERASQDIYTGGLDLVVVTKNGIDSYRKVIEDKIKEAKKAYIRDIKKSL